MTSRDIVIATLEFEQPERVARNLWIATEEDLDDFVTSGAKTRNDKDHSWRSPETVMSKYPGLKGFRGEVRYDEYGNLWGRLPGDFGGGEVLYGALQSWDDLKNYEMPNLSAKENFAHIKSEFDAKPDKFKMCMLPGFPFAIMRYIRKMEYFLEDLLTDPDKVMILNEMVTKELLGMIDNFAAAGCEGIFTCEDWGTQDRLLISPAMWRELFKPTLKVIFDRIHEHGMYVIMHSCGYIWEILGDLVTMGVDVMQLDSPELMGLDRVNELFGKSVTLFSSVDIQKILPTRNVPLVRERARYMIDSFCSKGGGLIVKDYGDYETIQIDKASVSAMHEEFVKYGAGLGRYYK